MAEYRFVLSGVTLPGAGDLFGIWDVPAVTGVSFDAAAAPTTPFDRLRTPPTWRVQLPASPDDAQAVLDTQTRALQHSTSDLVQAEQRLAQVGAGVSFDVTAAPEAELWAALNAIEAPVSFGLGRREETGDQWRAFLEQIRHVVSHCARIETEVGGTLVGHTSVGWTGDFDTLWEPDLTPQSMRSLRLLIVVGSGATRLALRLSVPGAQLLVLPAAFKFVRDVLKELRQSWPQIQKSGF
jgi:hypothetical protein